MISYYCTVCNQALPYPCALHPPVPTYTIPPTTPLFPTNTKTPHRCPVCYGTGFVAQGFYNSNQGIWTTGGSGNETCKSCTGSGIVWG